MVPLVDELSSRYDSRDHALPLLDFWDECVLVWLVHVETLGHLVGTLVHH